MRVLPQTCAGMDVHKKDRKICLGIRDSEGRCQEDVHSLRTLTRDLLAMCTWLQPQDIYADRHGVYRSSGFLMVAEGKRESEMDS